VPVSWLKLVAKLTGKQAVIERLCGDLQVSIEHTKKTLGWEPVVSMQQGILKAMNVN